jgi:hypothetical protein
VFRIVEFNHVFLIRNPNARILLAIVTVNRAAKEIKFVVQVLTSMGIPVRLLVICRVDNIGAVFMAENVSTSAVVLNYNLIV